MIYPTQSLRYVNSYRDQDRASYNDYYAGSMSSAGSRIPGSETNSLDGCDRDKSQLRPHQVHPAFDHHALLCYDDKLTVEAAVSPPVPVSMPPPPNICVEAGRIQFVRRDEDGAAVTAEAAAVNTQAVPRVTVTRGLQTDDLGNGTDVYEEDGVEEVQTLSFVSARQEEDLGDT
nr:unnamed protein product [Callosobruchus chinensis]